MLARRIIAAILIVLGIALFIFGLYISSQVKQGEEKIKRSEKAVHQTCSIIKVDPFVKKVGKVFTKPIQQKIAEGKETAQKYKITALILKISGIFFFILGIILFFFMKKKA